MTLDQLRIFCAVADHLHFTRAAEALRLSQPAVSSAIAMLEQTHGLHLFNRIGRRIELTQDGAAFLAEAKAVLMRVAAAEQTLRDLSGLRRGRLTLFASQTIASYWLPPPVADFAGRYPGIELTVAVGNTAQTAQAVVEGEADLGFAEGPVDDPRLAVRSLPGDRLVLVAAPGHPLAARTAIDPADLLEAQWVLREKGSGTRQIFDDALRERGLDPGSLRVVLELPNGEAIKTAVKAAPFLAVLSDLAAAPDLAAGTLRALPFPLPRRRFHILRHKEKSASRAEQALLDLIAARDWGE